MTSSKDKWYHAEASRVDVEQLVKNSGRDGSFAVRRSGTISGAFSLSLLYKNKVFTYHIIPTIGNKLAVQTAHGVQSKNFFSVDELVEGLKKPGNGLACALKIPVPRPSSFPTVVPGLRNSNNEFIINPTSGVRTTLGPPQLPPRQSTMRLQARTTARALPPRPPTTGVQPSAPPPVPPLNPAPNAQDSDVKQCKICFDAIINTFIEPCGHVCLCENCANQINECPICRSGIRARKKAFLP